MTHCNNCRKSIDIRYAIHLGDDEYVCDENCLEEMEKNEDSFFRHDYNDGFFKLNELDYKLEE